MQVFVVIEESEAGRNILGAFTTRLLADEAVAARDAFRATNGNVDTSFELYSAEVDVVQPVDDAAGWEWQNEECGLCGEIHERASRAAP